MKTRIINRRIYVLINLSFGIFLLFAPYVFSYEEIFLPKWVTTGTGTLIISLAMLSKTEPSLFRILPMKTHLAIDFLAGLSLCILPWFSGFGEKLSIIHGCYGMLLICLGILTKSRSFEASYNGVIGAGSQRKENLMVRNRFRSRPVIPPATVAEHLKSENRN